MNKPVTLKLVVFGTQLEDRQVLIRPAPDIRDAMANGYFCPPSDAGLPGVSFLLSASVDTALLVVDRDGDFIAEAIVSAGPKNMGELAVDLLSDDPEHDEWTRVLGNRQRLRKLVSELRPPCCLMVWKDVAKDRLTMDETKKLATELERVASGMAAELLNQIISTP